MKKKILSLLLAISMSISLMPAYEVQASKTICETYRGTNVEYQNYRDDGGNPNYRNDYRWSNPVSSYLSAGEDGILMRVQYGNNISEGILVEYYDAEYNIIDSKMIPTELPIFGGFYETDSNYFVVTGQNNPNESDTLEVVRVTKYDKQWNKIKSAGLKNCNTTKPFAEGSLRMDICGKYLLIRTSHQMYQTEDGYNHQSNMTIEVDTDIMTVTDSYTRIMNVDYGYVSHSFNQFIKIENNKIVSVDHSDGHPRAIALLKYKTDVSMGKFVPDYKSKCEEIDVMTFEGEQGNNYTGASVGGFEISSSKYLVTGASVEQDDKNTTRKTRNVFVAAVDKATSQVTTKWLTSYHEGEETVSNPHMVKITDDRYMILWSREGKVYYTEIDGNGNQKDDIYNTVGNLSDCVPVVSGEKLVWYTWNENVVTFYDIDLEHLSSVNKMEMVNGHNYENKGVVNGVASLECIDCKETTQVNVPTSIHVYWSDELFGNYWSVINTSLEVGKEVYCMVQYSPTEVNAEMEVISSVPSAVSVVEVQKATSGTSPVLLLTLKMEKMCKTTISVRPKWNPNVSQSFNAVIKGENGEEPSEEPTTKPSQDQTTKPEEDQTTKPEEDQTTKPEEEQVTKPEEEQTSKPDEQITTSNNEDSANNNTQDPSNNNSQNSSNSVNNSSSNQSGTNNQGNMPEQKTVQKNQTAVQNGVKYKVTKAAGSGQAEVSVVTVNQNSKSVAIPDTIIINGVSCKVTEIANNAFAKSKKLTKVVIGKNVKKIGKKAFYNCKKLKKITVKSNVLKAVGKNAIKGIHKKAVIKVPKKNLAKYKKLFGKKSGYKKGMKVKK